MTLAFEKVMSFHTICYGRLMEGLVDNILKTMGPSENSHKVCSILYLSKTQGKYYRQPKETYISTNQV